MKKRLLTLLLLLFVFSLSGCELLSSFIQPATSSTEVTSKKDDTTSVKESNLVIDKVKEGVPGEINRIYFTSINDTHGQLVEHGKYMSMSEVAGAIDMYESQYNQQFINIASGDIFQGSYVSLMTNGKCFIDCMNEMDYDAFVLGNHEFDWTLDKISIFWDGDPSNGEANFPCVCCNLIDTETKERPSWVKPYTVLQYGDATVGIIGAIEKLESSIAATSLLNYGFTEPISSIKPYIKELREKGCDVVVLSIHGYNDYSSSFGGLKEIYDLDAIFCGHTHEYIETQIVRTHDHYSIPVVQNNTKNENFVLVTINLDDDNHAATNSVKHINNSIFSNSSYQINQNVETIINSYKDIIDAGEEVIGYTSKYLGKYDCADWGVKAMMEAFDCDLGFVNSGGVRGTVPQGDITVSTVYEIYPFDNKVVVVTMTGAQIKEYLSRRSDLLTNYDFDSSALDDNQVYRVCTIDFVSNASNGYMLRYTTDGKVFTSEKYMRDVCVEYFKNNK